MRVATSLIAVVNVNADAQTSPTSYSALSCQVTTASVVTSQLSCVTSPGIGANLYWSLMLGRGGAIVLLARWRRHPRVARLGATYMLRS